MYIDDILENIEIECRNSRNSLRQGLGNGNQYPRYLRFE